jgi:hypothetical protein
MKKTWFKFVLWCLRKRYLPMTGMDNPVGEFENLYYFPKIAINTLIKLSSFGEFIELNNTLSYNDSHKMKITFIQNPETEQISHAFIDFGKENTTMDISNNLK